MKKINKIIRIIPSLFFLLILGTSCQKSLDEALERTADSRMTLAQELADPNMVRGMLQSCYAGIPAHRMYLYFWSSEETLTDNCFDPQGQSVGPTL